ncbi:MAG: CHAT domain-containing protein [Acidobacteriota bacterium]
MTRRRTGWTLWPVVLAVLAASVAGWESHRRHWVERQISAADEASAAGALAAARGRLQRAALVAPFAVEPRLKRVELELLAGEFRAAEQLVEPLLQRDLLPQQQARTLTAMARVALRSYYRTGLRQRTEAAVAAARASERPELEGQAYLATASSEVALGEPESALAALQRALELAELAQDARLRTRVMTELGYVRWWLLAEVEDPLGEYFEPALDAFRRLGDRGGEAYVLDHIANVSLRADDLGQFFAQQDQALRMWEELGNRSRQAKGHLQLGWAWDRLENPRRATRHLERALSLARDAGDVLLVPHVQRLLASVEITSRRPARAVARLERLKDQLRPWHMETDSVFGVLGDAHRRLGQIAAARAAYEHALALGGLDDPSFRVWIGSGLARLALAEGDAAEARSWLIDLEQRLRATEDWSDQRRVLSLRASVLAAELGREAALGPLIEAAEIETRSLGAVGRLTVDHGLGILNRLLPMLLQPPAAESADAEGKAPAVTLKPEARAAVAFRLLEQARMRPISRRRSGSSLVFPAVTYVTRAEDEALAAARAAAERVTERPSPEQSARLRAAYSELEEATLRSRAQAVAAGSLQAGTVAEIQARLPPRSTLVSYVLLRREAFALMLRDDRFEVLPLGFEPSDLRPRLKVLRHQLGSREGDGWRIAARGLWRLLLAPIAAAGGLEDRDRLYIVPMGDLYDVPFAALIDEAEQPLVEQVAVALLPAASLLLEADRRLATPGLVIARRDFDGLGVPALPAAEREAEAVASAFGARLLLGRAATEQRFHELAPGASLLHLVTHAQVEPEMPMLSRLLLGSTAGGGPATDGELTVRELLDLDLQAELVTLSACRTGLASPPARLPIGELRRGGLIEGLMRAGARNVLATLFPVEDQTTADFMIALAREIRLHPPIDALATVQRAAVRSGGSAAHPGHWSAFVLTGPGSNLIESRALPTASSTVSVEVQ